MSRELQAQLQKERAVSKFLLGRIEGMARDYHSLLPNHGPCFETCKAHSCEAYRYAQEIYYSRPRYY